eukprot:7468599-Pyramimonas_sp.AAC.5
MPLPKQAKVALSRRWMEGGERGFHRRFRRRYSIGSLTSCHPFLVVSLARLLMIPAPFGWKEAAPEEHGSWTPRLYPRTSCSS